MTHEEGHSDMGRHDESKGFWTYRAIVDDTAEEPHWEIREVYYGANNTIRQITEGPAGPFGESLEELVRDIEHMLTDAKALPVLSLREVLKGLAPDGKPKPSGGGDGG